MPLSGEMFIVISLMFAVFSAVAAVGTSIVLGVGFERLRAGFELVKKQTGFFSDAIHKLDQKTDEIQKSVVDLSTRMVDVEKQSGFFFESLHSLEAKILKGSPAQQPTASSDMPKVEAIEELEEIEEEPSMNAPNIDWSLTAETGQLLKKRQEKVRQKPQALQPEKPTSTGLSNMLVSYLMNDNSPDKRDVVYH